MVIVEGKVWVDVEVEELVVGNVVIDLLWLWNL